MAYFFPLLLYLSFGGGIFLLGVSSIPGLRYLRKPLSAAWVTVLALIWVLMPQIGRWVLSVWVPSSVAGGWMLLDLRPDIWWANLALGLAAAGVLWVSVVDPTRDLPLTSMLLALLLLISWAALSAGSLLMTLAMWAVFDVVWFVGRLIGDTDGDRVVWAAALHGAATITMWTVSLFLLRDGTSGLWWLMRPSESLLTLMLVAAAIRLGFYPFQVVHTGALSASRPLSLVGMLNPLMGLALLYRLMALPGLDRLPPWMLIWGCLTVFWTGLKALSSRGDQAFLSGGYGALLMGVTGAIAQASPAHLMIGAGIWVASIGLLLVSRRYRPQSALWFLPTWAALLFLMGVPPSPLGDLYRSVLAMAPWSWRLLFLLGYVFVGATLLQLARPRAKGRVAPPTMRRRITLVAGFVLSLSALFALTVSAGALRVEPLSFIVWVGGVSLSVAVVRWGGRLRALLGDGRAVVEVLDLQWFYRAAWQGAEHLLGSLRVGAEVVEGRGSVLWSVLVLLLVLLILGSE